MVWLLAPAGGAGGEATVFRDEVGADMSYAMKCPKCGLMQLPGPACKSCKAPLGGPARKPIAPRPPAAARPAPARPEARGPAPDRPASAASSRSPGERRALAFRGSAGTLFGIHAVNTLLTLLTLGVYYFWGKVKVRRYLFGQTEFEGDRFVFHGTGGELFLGTLKAVGIFLLPAAILSNLPAFVRLPAGAEILVGFLGWLLFMTFIPVAMVGARRYRLSRTAWRGVRFSFRGALKPFLRLFWTGGALTGLTLGLYYPFFETRQQAFFTGHTRFGSQGFDFDGEGKDLFWGFLLAAVLFPFTLGLSWVWYQARKRRYFWEHTHAGAATFRFPITGGQLLGLYLVNGLLLIFTLGLAWPWTVIRNVRFVCRHLRLEGPLDLQAIVQEADQASAMGEGLAGILDTDMGIGV